MAGQMYIGLLLTVFITVVSGGEWCTDYSYDWFDTDKDTFYCENGCCGDHDERHCCISSEVGMIIGIVIGVLALVAIVVSVIVCVCCCKRQRARQGQVIGGGSTAVNMTTTQYPAQPYTVATTQVGYPQMPMAYPPPAQPAPMNQGFANPPPAYNELEHPK